jgi:SAM-dependent methyltransferase
LPTVSLDKFVLHESPISNTSSSSSLSPPISDSAMDDESKERSKAVSGMTSLARLPHPNASVDVISARSLHKDVRVGGGLVDEPRERLRAWLEECHRVLVPGGRLEYIYFGDKLLYCGPLTGELEAVLWDVWAENSAGGDGQGPTTDDFIALLNQVGFTDRRHLTMRFGLFTLRSLFDHRGVQRRGKATALSVEQHQPGSRHPPVPGTVGPQDYIDQKAHELLFRVYEECASRETGWECVMGYSTKAC